MPDFLSFLTRFRTAMVKEFPKAKLVVATTAGPPLALINGLEKIVDNMLVMTYNYRWSGSTVTGAIAPLDNTARTVKIHIGRYLKYTTPSKIIMGVPYYGYDWPVTSNVPNATVNKPDLEVRRRWSVTYSSSRKYLAAHPDVLRREDTAEGSAFFTYWDAEFQTYRQVYFEDEHSAAAKYDYAIASGLAGIGIWTLDNDRGYTEMYDVIRAKFYDPTHRATVGASVKKVSLSGGSVRVSHTKRVKNTGNVPENGTLVWRIYDRSGPPAQAGLARPDRLPRPDEDRHDDHGHRLGSQPATRHLHAEGPVPVEGRDLEDRSGQVPPALLSRPEIAAGPAKHPVSRGRLNVVTRWLHAWGRAPR